jgi:hypothetical protein
MADSLSITIDAAPASDSWGFVGRVLVGEHEAYRTIRAYTTPDEAVRVTQRLVSDVMGSLLAGQEWRSAEREVGHAPRRTELQFGLAARKRGPDQGDVGTDSPGGRASDGESADSSDPTARS